MEPDIWGRQLQKHLNHPVVVKGTLLDFMGNSSPKTDEQLFKPAKDSKMVYSQESGHTKQDRPYKTNRFPFCKETGVTVEDMRKPHMTSLGVVPMKYSSSFGMHVVLEGRPLPTVCHPQPTTRISTPEKEVLSARLPWTPASPLISPQLPSVKPCILPAIGTSQKITLKPRPGSAAAAASKRLEHDYGFKLAKNVASKKMRPKERDLDMTEVDNEDRESIASSAASVQSLVEEAKQIALAVDRRLPPKKLQRLPKIEDKRKMQNKEEKLKENEELEADDDTGTFSKRKPKRTVDEIIVSLHQSRQKKTKRLSSADRKIREIMRSVVMRTRAVLGNIVTPLTEDWNSNMKSVNIEMDEMEDEESDEMSEVDSDKEDLLLESGPEELHVEPESGDLLNEPLAITPGEAQLIEETLAQISESETELQLTVDDREEIFYNSAKEDDSTEQNGEEFSDLKDISYEDMISAVGRSCYDPLKHPSMSLLHSWQMNTKERPPAADTLRSSRGIYEKKIVKRIHHFCMMRHEVQLPDPYRGVWSRYIIRNKYKFPSQDDAVEINGEKQRDKASDVENSLHQHQLEAAEHILEEATKELKNSMNAGYKEISSKHSDKKNQLSEKVELVLQGKKLKIGNDSMIYWTPAPPKWNVAPSRVKEVLFPEYHGSEYAAKNLALARKMTEERKKNGVIPFMKKMEQTEPKEVQEEQQKPVVRPRMYGSQENLSSLMDATRKEPERRKMTSSTLCQQQSNETMQMGQDLMVSYKEYSEWKLNQVDVEDSAETESPPAKKKLRRSNSAPDDLDKDDNFLVIYQDFRSTVEELQQQKQQIQQIEDGKVMNRESPKATDAQLVDAVMMPNEESVFESVPEPVDSLQQSALMETSLEADELKSRLHTQTKPRMRYSRRMSKRRKSALRRESSLVFIEFVWKSLESHEPQQLIRSESTRRVTEGAVAVPLGIQKGRWKSVPDLLNFEVFKETHGWKNEEIEREWVRNIWSGWFNEVFPPTPRFSMEEFESNHETTADDLQNKGDFSENKVKKMSSKYYDADEVALSPIVDEDSLTADDVKLLEEEVEKLTVQISRSKRIPNAYDLCRRGAILRRLGRIKLALDDLNAAIDLEPQLIDAYWHRHLISILLNRKQFAIEDLSSILRQNKSHSPAYKSRAMLMREMGDLTLAVFNLTQVLKFKPDDTDALLQRAEIYEATGDMLLAVDDYASCRHIDPTLTKASMKHGLYHFRNSIWDTAVDDFSHVLTFEPGNAEVRLLRGRAYMHLKMWNESLEDISTAIHMDPLSSKAFYYRGCILRKIYPRRALQDYSVSLMLDDSYDNFLAYLHRGILYNDLGQVDEAIADFEAVLRLDPSFASALVNLGLLYMKIPKNITQLKAIQKFTGALKADPTLVKAYMCRAEVYQKLNDLKNALLDVTRAIHLCPDMIQLYMWRGDLLHKMGNMELATFCLHQMSLLNISAIQRPSQQAVMQSFLKNYDKAIDVLLEATSGNEASVRLMMMLGETQMKAGHWNDAIASFSSALKLMMSGNLNKSQQNLKKNGEKLLPSEAGKAYYLIGVCHMEESSFLSALDAFTNAIKADPKHAEAFYWRGFTKLKLNHSKGILDINTSLALDPTQFQAYLTRAAYYGLRGQYSKAILNCNEAIRLQPSSIRAFLYRGALKFFMKSYILAIRDLTKATTIDSTCALAYFNRAVCYHANNNLQKALQDYGVVLLLADEMLLLKAFINRAMLYIEMKDYYNALYDLLWAAELSPTDKKIYHTLGICHHKLYFLKESISCFTKALELDRFFLDALIGRGNAFMDFGHDMGYLHAKHDYERVLHIDPLCLPARVNLAYCLQVTGKFMRAWHQFTTAITIDPSFVPALEGRAVINLQMSDTFAAYQDISASIRVRPTAELLTNRGVIHQFMNDKVNAMRDYQRAIEVDPTYALAYFNAANTYFHSHQFSQALSYYNTAISCDERDESAYLNRAITHVMLKDAKNALEDFERASALSPYSAHIYFNRANLYMSLQMYAKAETDYSRAISLQPDDPLMLMRRGDVLNQLQQHHAASQDYQAAVQLEDLVD